jgi:hypothetical protein
LLQEGVVQAERGFRCGTVALNGAVRDVGFLEMSEPQAANGQDERNDYQRRNRDHRLKAKLEPGKTDHR